ncbi:MAG: response regulator [Thermodesulfobacteriota bacterium]
MKSLVAEDDFVSRMIMQEMLSPFGICHIAVDGKEALSAYHAALESGEPYDLICLDIMMPGMDGQEVLAKIREHERAAGIGGSEIAKVVMTTALNDPQNIMKSLIKGHCEAYLIKPIDKDKLLNELSKLGLISQ